MRASDAADLPDLPLALRVEDVADLLGIGRTAAYAAVRAGEVPSIRIGRRVLVPRAGLLRLLGEAPIPADPDTEVS